MGQMAAAGMVSATALNPSAIASNKEAIAILMAFSTTTSR